MLHKPATQAGPDPASRYKQRLGALMFVMYALVYAGFVAINVISPMTMEVTVLFGLNLATMYGFGLIIFALLAAFVYNRLCRRKELEFMD